MTGEIIPLRPEQRINAPMSYYDPDGTLWAHYSTVDPLANIWMRRYRLWGIENVCTSIRTIPPQTADLYWGPRIEPPPPVRPSLWTRIRWRIRRRLGI